MTPLTEFMQLNKPVILFIYGLVFFSLGTTVALQSRSYSRLQLARSLKWLAAFGIIHGVHEWGDLFIPMQASNMSESTLLLWTTIQLLTLAISFACLFAFGFSLLQPLKRAKWVLSIPLIVLIIWGLTVFVLLPSVTNSLIEWRNISNALARYFLAFPAGLLAAYSLRWHSNERIAPLNARHITRNLRYAGVAIFLYAFFGGLVVPPIPFFPGNYFNSVTFTQLFGIPPIVFRSIIGLALAFFFIRALEVFDLECAQQIEGMEQQQILAVERQRIARDLHDGAIQSAYSAGLLVESASRLAEPDSELKQRLERAVVAMNGAIGDMRHNLEELQTSPTSQPLKTSLLDLLRDPRFASLLEIHSQLDLDECLSLSPIRSDHVKSIVQEALSNVVRHAHAQQAWVSANQQGNRMLVVIRDDGRGLSEPHQEGYGLRNMHDRARMLGGSLSLENTSEGTAVTLDYPWDDEL